MDMTYTTGEFGIFPAKILKGLHPYKQVIISWLIFHTNNESGISFPSLSLLSKECGISSRSTLIKHISELESEGYIQKTQMKRDDGGYTSNRYRVFIKRTSSSTKNKQGVVPEVDTNYKKVNNKNTNLFEECWKLYGCKGNKQTALRYWNKLSNKDHKSIKDKILPYIESRPDKVYRKDMQAWINPTNRMWEDEIVTKEEQRKVVEI